MEFFPQHTSAAPLEESEGDSDQPVGGMKKSLRVALVSLLFLCCWAEHGVAEHLRYKDPRQPLNVRLNDLLSRMTLAEKIGQMMQIERADASAAVAKQHFVGSVMSGAGSAPFPKAPPEAWIDMVDGIQRAALSTRLGIPIIYGTDAVHGHNNAYRATIFPHNVGIGATRDPSLAKRIGAATALEMRATGIPYTFAPCVAVCRDPRWGRCYESYGEDPKLVQEMTEVISGLQGDIPGNSSGGVPFASGKDKVAACAKHYVGDGGTTRGVDEDNTVVNRHALLSIHMPPYYSAVKRGVATVMVSFSSWNGVKMHANYDLVTNFLKGTLHFRGFVITDWQGIEKISDPPYTDLSHCLRTGIKAGIDMVMGPSNLTELVDDLTNQVNSGSIPMSRIDDAVRRILRVKFSMGLFENPMADKSLVNQLGSPEHRALAREAVRKSLVLLKNGKSPSRPLLPLPKKAANILVAGTHAHNLGYQCGGWTMEWQGFEGNNRTVGTTILEAVRSTVNPLTRVVFSENPDADFVKQGNFSYAVVAVGERPYAEMFGDSAALTVVDPGPSTIGNVCGSVRCAVVVVSGRPVVVEPFLAVVDALVAAWLPGSEGGGVADVLFGDHEFSGKLPRTWFRSVDQLPMNAGDPHYDPLFPFGFGLTTKI